MPNELFDQIRGALQPPAAEASPAPDTSAPTFPSNPIMDAIRNPLGAMLQQRAKDNVPWKQVQGEIVVARPDVDPTELRTDYEKERGLTEARGKFKDYEQSTGRLVAREAVPFFSAGMQLGEGIKFRNAMDRIEAGKGSHDDFNTVAYVEKQQTNEKNLSTLGTIGHTALRIPAVLGEAAATGGSSLLGRAALSQTPKLLTRAGLAQLGKTTLMTPSVYLPGAAQSAINSGGQPTDISNLAPSVAMGAINLAVLGRLSGLGRSAVNQEGRIGLGIIAQGVGQQAADIGTSALDDTVKAATGYTLGLNTRYGIAGELLSKDGEPLKHSLSQALMFGVFAALHSGRGGRAIAEDVPGGKVLPMLGGKYQPAERPAAAGKPYDQAAYKGVMDGYAQAVDNFARRGTNRRLAAKGFEDVNERFLKELKESPETEYQTMRDDYEERKNTPIAPYVKSLVDLAEKVQENAKPIENPGKPEVILKGEPDRVLPTNTDDIINTKIDLTDPSRIKGETPEQWIGRAETLRDSNYERLQKAKAAEKATSNHAMMLYPSTPEGKLRKEFAEKAAADATKERRAAQKADKEIQKALDAARDEKMKQPTAPIADGGELAGVQSGQTPLSPNGGGENPAEVRVPEPAAPAKVDTSAQPDHDFRPGGPLQALGGLAGRFGGNSIHVIPSPDNPKIAFVSGLRGKDVAAAVPDIIRSLRKMGFEDIQYRPDGEDGRSAARARLFEGLRSKFAAQPEAAPQQTSPEAPNSSAGPKPASVTNEPKIGAKAPEFTPGDKAQREIQKRDGAGEPIGEVERLAIIQKHADLSDREAAAWLGVSRGIDKAEIARHLGVSGEGVAKIVKRADAKIGLPEYAAEAVAGHEAKVRYSRAFEHGNIGAEEAMVEKAKKKQASGRKLTEEEKQALELDKLANDLLKKQGKEPSDLNLIGEVQSAREAESKVKPGEEKSVQEAQRSGTLTKPEKMPPRAPNQSDFSYGEAMRKSVGANTMYADVTSNGGWIDPNSQAVRDIGARALNEAFGGSGNPNKASGKKARIFQKQKGVAPSSPDKLAQQYRDSKHLEMDSVQEMFNAMLQHRLVTDSARWDKHLEAIDLAQKFQEHLHTEGDLAQEHKGGDTSFDYGAGIGPITKLGPIGMHAPTPEGLPAPPPTGESMIGGVPGNPGRGRVDTGPRVFAMAREKVTESRAARDLAAMEKAVPQSDKAAWDAAKAKYAADPQAGDKLVDRIESTGMFNAKEDVPLLLLHRVALENELSNRETAYASSAGRPDAEREVMRRQAQDAAEKLNKLDYLTDNVVGNQLGYGLRLFRLLARDDYTLAGLLRKAEVAKGEPLTAPEKEKVKEVQKEVQEAQKEEKAGEDKGDDTAKQADRRIRTTKARRQVEETVQAIGRSNRPIFRQVAETVGQTGNLARSLITSYDLSAVFRQGGILTFAHPIRAARAIPDMLRAAFSEKSYDRMQDALRQRENAKNGLYGQAKLYLAEMSDSPTRQEEAFIGRLTGRIPGVGASARAYTAFLNRMRADIFDVKAASLARNGKPTVIEAKAIGNFVNQATGRGSLDLGPIGSFERSAVPLAHFFFSPRYFTSRIAMLAGQPFYQGNARTRRLIATEYARAAVGVGLFYLLAKLAWPDSTVEGDPRSSDYGKIRMGNTRVDPLMGFGSIITAANRIVRGKTKNAKGEIQPLREDASPNGKLRFGARTVKDVAGDFVRTKLAPVPGVMADVAFGNRIDQKPVTFKNEASGLVVPIVTGDIIKAFEDQNVPRATAISLLTILGMGQQTYEPKVGQR